MPEEENGSLNSMLDEEAGQELDAITRATEEEEAADEAMDPEREEGAGDEGVEAGGKAVSAEDEGGSKSDAADASAGDGSDPDKESNADKEDADRWRGLEEKFGADPVAFNVAFFSKLSPKQQADYLAALGVAPDAANRNEAQVVDWESLTPQEVIVEKRKDWIENGPQQVLSELAWRDEVYGQAALDVTVLQAQVEYLTGLLEATLPAVDQSKIISELNKGKTLHEAVAAIYKPELAKAKTVKAQAEKPKPNTPGNSSAAPRPLRNGASLKECLASIMD